MKRLRWLPWLWVAVVCACLAQAVYLIAAQRLQPDTDILTLLPVQDRDPVLQRAFTHMVDSAQQRVIVLVGASTWSDAQRAAKAYQRVLAKHADLLTLSTGGDPQAQQGWLASFAQHRPVLLTDADENMLRKEDSSYWTQQALHRLYNAFGGPKMVPWQEDPFGLFGNWLETRAQETPVRPRDGMLHVAAKGKEYVVLPMNLRVPALSMNGQKTVLPVLGAARAAALEIAPKAEVLSAGVVLHAAAASSGASREATTIGAGSMLGIVLLMWLSFRSLKPIGLVFLSIAVGCLGATIVCAALFERIHLMTLVFGASLIGVAQDYGIYFLCHRAGTKADSMTLMRRLLPSLLLTLIAAVVGYMALALTPFPGLRQMAVFSACGLVFAWMTVVCWFPTLLTSQSLSRSRFVERAESLMGRWPVLAANRGSVIVICLFGALIAGGVWRLHANDDIRLLSNSPKFLLDDQIKLSHILDTPSPVQFFLVRGATEEDVLQREEELKEQLASLMASGAIGGVQAISNWVPSQRLQQTRRQLIDTRLFGPGGALEGVVRQVNEDAQWQEQIRARNREREPLLPSAFLASPAGEPWRHLWLDKVENNYASIVALRGVTPATLPDLSRAASNLPGVQWVDKVSDISSLLGRYRQQMSKVLLLSYGAVWLLLFWRYRAVAWRILLPVAAGSAATLAVLGLAGQSLQLFHVLAFMLLLGIGVDYGVFMQDRGAAQGTGVGTAWMAVALSACSTLLSFGLLGLSHTPALQAFGTTMLLGATFVCLLVPCFQRRAERGALSPEVGRK